MADINAKATQAMTDEELDAALLELGVDNPTGPTVEEPAVEEPVVPETPPADPAKEEVEPPVEEPVTPPAAEPPKADPVVEPEPSRREVKRIQDLLQKYPKPAPAKPEPKTPEGALDINKDVDADEELKKRLLADRDAAAKTAYEQGRNDSNQEKANILFHTRLEIDAPRVEAKYPVLDKDSDKFNMKAATDVNTAYLQASGYDIETETVTNPNIRYSDFVEAFFEVSKELAQSMVEETKKNVTSQVAKTGLRPGGETPKPKLNLNQLPQNMSDEELDAIIAQAIPSK